MSTFTLTSFNCDYLQISEKTAIVAEKTVAAAAVAADVTRKKVLYFKFLNHKLND
jgi:hypothetical protein